MLAALHAVGVEARHGFKPMHLQPVFAGNPVRGGAVADTHFATSLSLPSGGRITDPELDLVTETMLGVRRR